MIFGKTFSEKQIESKGRDYDDAVANLKRQIVKAIASEREACALLADSHKLQHEGRDYPPGIRNAVQLEAGAIAEAIRARGSQ
jgi:hypothetical protein